MDWTQIVVALISSGVVLAGYIIVDRREKNKQYEKFKEEIKSELNSHRSEYLTKIDDVKNDILEIKAVYQQNQAIIELKIDTLEKKQDQHNNLITRMYAVESSQKLQEEQIKLVNHRIEDLERK